VSRVSKAFRELRASRVFKESLALKALKVVRVWSDLRVQPESRVFREFKE
jgi:hypothetical protein